jgi:hypothetical protein
MSGDADADADAVASVGDDNVDSVIICGDAERSWATLTPGGKRAGGVDMAGRIGSTP